MTELDDDREAIEPEAPDEDAGDPAAAFDALRRTIEAQGAQIGAEMTVMRRGLEAAFDQLEKIEPAQDYKPQLAQLVQALDNVAERMHGVEQSPILRQGAQHYAALLERSGEALIRTAALELERQASDLERAGRNLSAHVASAREHDRQNWWLVVAFAVGLLAGALVMLFLPRVLPGSVDMAVAATVMNADRWNAGAVLMKLGRPGEWNNLAAANDLVRNNRDALVACAEAAVTAKRDQKCTVTVAAPAQ